MNSNYSIGRVHKVFPNKLIVEIPDTKEIQFVYNGEFYETNGINTFLTLFNGLNKRFVFQIIGLYEHEKPFIDEEYAKLTSYAYFECIPIGEVEDNEFDYGLVNYAMIGDEVYLTSTEDLDFVFNRDNFSLQLGVIPSQNEYVPKISIDGLFTHHMSILGNTNSGKSTTVRKLIQKLSTNSKINHKKLNFLIFDIHNEYNFLNSNLMNSISMDDVAINLENLTVEDWINLVRPSDKVQLPILKQAIKLASLLHEEKNLSNAIIVYAAAELLQNQSTDGLAKRNTVISLIEKTDFIKKSG